MRLSRRALGIGTTLLLLTSALVAWRVRPRHVRYATASVERGDVVDVVGATGTLQAVTTVQVGSQVSGNILSLHADFNSVVKKGAVVARLDPSIFEARLAQSRASLVTASANVDRARATLSDTLQKFTRAQELSSQNLLPSSDLETAKANQEVAVASLKAAEAAVKQAEANLNQAQVDLGHTVITAPIDGVVIARNVDVGQTVAASFQAPTLFVIANDLTRMQVNAAIGESDIGRVRDGQDVTFRVDAYPERNFSGTVEQIRLQPITNQNVVTYNTIIAVENADQKLMPGMTATVSLIVQARHDVLRMPASALRFRPEGFDARRPQASGPGAVPAASSGGPARPQGDRPEMSAGAQQPGARGGGERRRRGLEGEAGSQHRGAAGEGGAERRGMGLVFVAGAHGRPEAARVKLGISDGRMVEVVEGLDEGALVITGLEDPARSGAGVAGRPGGPSPGAANPFQPNFRPRQR